MHMRNPSKGAFVTQRKSDHAILIVKPLGESYYGMLPERLPDIYLQKFVTAQTAAEFLDAIAELDPLVFSELTEDEPRKSRFQPAESFFKDFEDNYEAVDFKRFSNLATPYLFRGPREYTNAVRVLEAADIVANPGLREWLASVYSKYCCAVAVEPLGDWALLRTLAAETLAVKDRHATGETALIYQGQIDLVKDHSPLYKMLSTSGYHNFMDGSVFGIAYQERGIYRLGQTEYDHTIEATCSDRKKPLSEKSVMRFIGDELDIILTPTPRNHNGGLEPHFESAYDVYCDHIECTHDSQLSQTIYSAALYGRPLRGICSDCGIPLFDREVWDFSVHYENLCYRCHERRAEREKDQDKELTGNEDTGNR